MRDDENESAVPRTCRATKCAKRNVDSSATCASSRTTTFGRSSAELAQVVDDCGAVREPLGALGVGRVSEQCSVAPLPSSASACCHGHSAGASPVEPARSPADPNPSSAATAAIASRTTSCPTPDMPVTASTLPRPARAASRAKAAVANSRERPTPRCGDGSTSDIRFGKSGAIPGPIVRAVLPVCRPRGTPRHTDGTRRSYMTATSYYLGIDLGTTFTAAAVHRNGRTDISPLGNRAAVDSVAGVPPGRRDDAHGRSRRTTRTRRTHSTRPGIQAPGRRQRPDHARSSALLRGTTDGRAAEAGRRRSRDARGCSDPIASQSATPPTGARSRSTSCATRSTSPACASVTLVTEPVAAAMHYASTERVEPGAVVAVYDLGGGTFDAAVLQKTETGFVDPRRTGRHRTTRRHRLRRSRDGARAHRARRQARRARQSRSRRARRTRTAAPRVRRRQGSAVVRLRYVDLSAAAQRADRHPGDTRRSSSR